MSGFIGQEPGIKGDMFTVNSHVHRGASWRRQILEGSGIEKKIKGFAVAGKTDPETLMLYSAFNDIIKNGK